MIDKVQELSVVHLAPIAHAIKLNEMAELVGMGPNNLSVLLVDLNGNEYLANHAWWHEAKFTQFKNVDELAALGLNMVEYVGALTVLQEFVIDTAEMLEDDLYATPDVNFSQALQALGLHEPIVPPESEVE